MSKGKIPVLFPEGVEKIIISKNDYDRLYGEMTLENIELKQEIEQLKNRIKELEEINRDHQRMNIELREENKRLKKYLDDKMKDLQNIYTQYIRLQNTYEDLYEKYIDIIEGRTENE